MNPLSNPSYLLPPLVTLVSSIILLVVVWRGTQRNFSNKIFCGVLLSVALWSAILFGMRASHEAHQALSWDRALTPTVYATYLLYYHFTLAYTNTKGQRGILIAAYLILVVVAALSPTDLLIEKMRLEYYGYAPVPGPVAIPFAASGLLLLGGGAYNIFKRYKTSHLHEERNRLLYLAIAVIFPLTGALLDGFSDLPPAAVWGYLIFCIVCSVAIVKYHLLDIRIIVRKSLIYFLISAMVAIPYVGLLYLLQYFIEPAMESWWVHALMILFLAILIRPLYSRAQNLVNRLFYRDRYDYLRAMERFSRETQSIADLKELGSSMVQLVRGALRASSACLLLPSEGKHGLVVVSCTGLESPTTGVVLRKSSPLVKWLELHEDILSAEQLSIIPQLQSSSLKEKENLERMGARLYVPIKTRQGQLSGILILGLKLSQQSYSDEERQLLITLSNQMAMALENARLYESERAMREELEKQNVQKTEFLHSVAHELKTPMTAIIASSELLYEEKPRQSGIIAKLANNIRQSAGSMDRRVSELLDLAQMQVGELRIEPEPLEIGHMITEVAMQIRILFQNREQTLALEIPDSLPEVSADRGKLEQVLFNLLSNANKFSPTGSDIVLRAREEDRRIVVEVEDSAPVVTEEEKRKLFDPYYRGEDVGKRRRLPGLGLGLAISKKIVELHQGEIWVDSKPGKGNTFAFSLPVPGERTNGIK